MKDYLYFKARELKCKCGYCDGGEMDQRFMEQLISTREACGFPFKLTSAFRCNSHNKNIFGTRLSPHLFGRAVDIRCSSSEAIQIINLGLHFGLTGFGVKQKLGSGIHERFLHVDNFSDKEKTTARRPAIWSY